MTDLHLLQVLAESQSLWYQRSVSVSRPKGCKHLPVQDEHEHGVEETYESQGKKERLRNYEAAVFFCSIGSGQYCA